MTTIALQSPLTVRGNSRRLTAALAVTAFLSAALILFIGSKSSALYPMNDWVDVHCFFTIGRGIVHGRMPYMDLYDQKGPLLYLVYAVAALISETSFIGVFLIEVLLMGIFLLECARIARLWIRDDAWILPMMPAIAVSLVLSKCFRHGCSAEEFALPLFALGLRLVLTSLQAGRALKPRELAMLGWCVAAALWIKYTFCGFFAGLILVLLVCYLVKKLYREIPRAILWGLAGAASLTMPILLWFLARGALPVLWDAYFVNNLTAYGASEFNPRYDLPLQAFIHNWPWSLPTTAGILALLADRRSRWSGAAALAAVAAAGVFTYIGKHNYPYYAMALAPACCLGWIALLRLLSRYFTAGRGELLACSAALLLAVNAVLTWNLSENIYLAAYRKEDMPQYRFAEIINQTPGATLDNWGFLDGGFYYAAGIIPDHRFFCSLNITIPESKERWRIAGERTVNYLVTRNQDVPEGYTKVAEAVFPFEGRDWTYGLWERN